MTTTGSVTNVTGGYYTNTSGTKTGDSNATKTADGTSMDKDAFLKLLVAQLKYQSPDAPVDTNQFMAQTAQMTQVETMQNLAKAQQSSLLADQSSLATSMIGKSITATNSLGGSDINGTVTGVRLGTDGPVLKVGNTEVALSAVKEVNASTTA